MRNICIISSNYTYCMIIQNWYYAIINLFPNDNVFIYDKNISTLDKVDILFILDEHFIPNNEQWNYSDFIKRLDNSDIQVVILNVEKVWNSAFPWNEDYQRTIDNMKNVTQFFIDIEDAARYNHKYLNKCLISKNFKNKFNISETKINKAVFVGQYEASWHKERKDILEKVSKVIEVDVFKRDDNKRSTEDYINLISQYIYVVAPISTAISIPPRFWEILFVGSIPIQQIKPGMERYYEELQFEDCIYFNNPNEIPEKIANHKFEKTNHEMWYEDNLKMMIGDKFNL